jgi:hypothetical protein
VRSWWLAYETKLRCRSTNVEMRSAIRLNVVVSCRSSGGPDPPGTRSPKRPSVKASAALSRSRTGRSIHRASGTAAATPTARTSRLTPTSRPQLRSVTECSVAEGETVTATPMISPPRPTGSATMRGSSLHGHRPPLKPARSPDRAASIRSRTRGAYTSKSSRDVMKSWPSRPATAAAMPNIASYCCSSVSSASL